MTTSTKEKTTATGQKPERDVGQFVFITVGLAIVLGGLWLLYGGSGPYHP